MHNKLVSRAMVKRAWESVRSWQGIRRGSQIGRDPLLHTGPAHRPTTCGDATACKASRERTQDTSFAS